MMTKATIRTVLTDDVVLKKRTDTTADDVFGTVAPSYTDYNIKAKIVEITSEDLRYMPSGVYNEGDSIGYFYSSYTIDNSSLSVAVNDLVEYNSKVWRVDKVTSIKLHNTDLIQARMVKYRD